MLNNIGFDPSAYSVYYGYYLDENKLMHSSSGGIASALSEEFINRGGVVFGVRYSDDFRCALYSCARCSEDLNMFKGSKYIPAQRKVRTNGKDINVFEAVKEEIRANNLILFIGLGCDVAGLRNFLISEKISNYDRLFTVDLVCHGSTYPIVHEQYIDTITKKYKSNLTSFNVRYKRKHWIPSYIHAEFENGRIHEERFSTSDYGIAFHRLSRPGCYKCPFRSNGHQSDITVGDYWGLSKGMNEYNSKGVSLVFVSSNRGMDLLKMLNDDVFRLGQTDKEFALSCNGNFYKEKQKRIDYDDFYKSLMEDGLHDAVKKYASYQEYLIPIKNSIKQYIPSDVKRYIKKIIK